MKRVFLLVLDSLGLGSTRDAHSFGDAGANTLGHIASACLSGGGDREGLRQGPLAIPNLFTLGLGRAALDSARHSGLAIPPGLDHPGPLRGSYGFCEELSAGKDTPSGHWEICGLPVNFAWHHFPDIRPCFPQSLTDAMIEGAGLPGVLGNCHRSGTVILDELGEAHIESGKPIVYTSADSIVQIAAHEQHFGLERLYALCALTRRLVDPLNVGRVIARPFVGEQSGQFVRTGNRRDYTTPPHADTLLDRLRAAGNEVIGIGKIGDIFSGRGLSQSIKAHGNTALFDATVEAAKSAPGGSLVFTNFVDFDMLYGHRRDLPGYAAALEAFDARLPELKAFLRATDLLILTADHGCDPSWAGSDHTREHVPVLVAGDAITEQNLGCRRSFADIGQSVASYLGLNPLAHGESFL
jgi:phosphopentomutase